LQGLAGFYKEDEEAPRKEETGGITFCSSIPVTILMHFFVKEAYQYCRNLFCLTAPKLQKRKYYNIMKVIVFWIFFIGYPDNRQYRMSLPNQRFICKVMYSIHTAIIQLVVLVPMAVNKFFCLFPEGK
jgi:hypothetical protein